MIKNQTYKDVLLVVFLLIVSYVAVYLSPSIVRAIIFMIMVVFFIRTKNNAPWIVFFFLLFSAPATLFYGPDRHFLFITKTVGIPFAFIVSLAFLYKGLKSKLKSRNRFAIERNIFLFVMLLLVLVGFMWGGLSLRSLFIIVTDIPYILLILFLPMLINMDKDYERIKKLLYVFTILLFVIQLFEVILGHGLFNAGKLFFNKEDGTQRNITGIFFVFFTFIISLSDVLSNRKKIKSLEFITVFVSILLLINSGTRGWMIATGFILISLLFLGNKPRVALISIISTALIGLVLTVAPPKYIDNITGSFERLSSVLLMIEGDQTAGGTLSRVSERGPRVMNKFKESPVLGFGYSDIYVEYMDGHVANQSLLLQAGIFGFIILYIIIFRILWHFFSWYLLFHYNNKFKFRILSMLIGFLGIMVINSSSRAMVHYHLDQNNAMLLAFWFLFTFYYLDKAKKYETNLNKY